MAELWHTNAFLDKTFLNLAAYEDRGSLSTMVLKTRCDETPSS